MNRFGKVLLVAALVVVVGMAFRVSWNALSDIARSVGADETAARLYPFVVDGLMALALVATLVLTDQTGRRFALRVLAGYTIASLVLNYVHGLVPDLHGTSVDWGRLADWSPANWALVLLATSLPVGAIYFGSELVAKVIHHRPEAPHAPARNAKKSTSTTANQSHREQPKHTVTAPGESGRAGVEESPAGPVQAPVTEVSRPRLVAPDASIEDGASGAAESAPTGSTGASSGGSGGGSQPVPKSARSTTRPKRDRAQLLDEARTASSSWSDEELTANALRLALRTSAQNARTVRDELQQERVAGRAAEMRHLVDPLDGAFARLAPGRAGELGVAA